MAEYERSLPKEEDFLEMLRVGTEMTDGVFPRSGDMMGLYPKFLEGCLDYYRDDKDVVIRKIILNIFSATKDVFPVEWSNPQKYVLSKAIGYGGILKALPDLVKKGRENMLTSRSGMG